jgi:hypothetical protein
LSEQRGGGETGTGLTGAPERPARPDFATQADRLCAEIRDRARYLAERARGLSASEGALARHARARLLEVDAETIADLA